MKFEIMTPDDKSEYYVKEWRPLDNNDTIIVKLKREKTPPPEPPDGWEISFRPGSDSDARPCPTGWKIYHKSDGWIYPISGTFMSCCYYARPIAEPDTVEYTVFLNNCCATHRMSITNRDTSYALYELPGLIIDGYIFSHFANPMEPNVANYDTVDARPGWRAVFVQYGGDA